MTIAREEVGRVGLASIAVAHVAYAAIAAPVGLDPAGPVLATVREVMASDSAGFYRHTWYGASVALHIDPIEVWRIIPFRTIPTWRAAALNPGIEHLVSQRPAGPFAVTDVISERLWWGSELHAAMKTDWGRNYQFAIPVVDTEPIEESHVWVLGRTTNRFGPRDREVASAIAPVLSAVARHRSEINRLEVSPLASEVLTQREIAVLELLAEGLTAPAVGRRLLMSARTVHKHAEHIYAKLGVHSRADAVRMCAELGIAVRSTG